VNGAQKISILYNILIFIELCFWWVTCFVFTWRPTCYYFQKES